MGKHGAVTDLFARRRSLFAFWLGCAAVTAGVLTHVPMFLMGRHNHYVLAGMPMGTAMIWGMAAIVAGIVLTGYGLLPLTPVSPPGNIEPIAKAIDAVQSHSTSTPTSFAQKGAVAALTGPQVHLQAWLAEFNKRRTFAWKRLNGIPGLSCVNARGAFYLFPNISRTGLKSSEFCARLLEAEKVAAVPGIAFGADDYLRISYATSMANIEKGLERIERFCRGLQK